jgi:hypothetical protein
VILRVEVVRRAFLHALWIVAPYDVIAAISLFPRLGIARTPDELFGTSNIAVIFLDDLNALTEPIVSELASMRADVDGSQSIQRVPFIGICTIAEHVPIQIVSQR